MLKGSTEVHSTLCMFWNLQCILHSFYLINKDEHNTKYASKAFLIPISILLGNTILKLPIDT